MTHQPAIVDLLDISPDFVRDPYPVYAKLRAQGPVHHVRAPGGRETWLVVGHDACRAAFNDPRLSRDWRRSGTVGQIINADQDHPALAHMLMADPPDHTRLRRLVSREFTPRRIAALAPRIQQITDELLDAMEADPRRRGDLVDAFAFPLPMTVICELLGVPELDREAFRSWSNEMVAPTSPEAEGAAYAQMPQYLSGLIEAKRAAPGQDLLSGMIHAVDEGGDRLGADELIGMSVLLLIAGHETTVNMIGNGLRALFDHPEQFAALRADLDGLLDGALEEMLRHDGPVENSTERLALEDVEMGGVVIPAGSTVLISMADADRDPARFEDAGRFDIHRDARGHIAFGHGLHHCLGAPLARMEGRIALRSLLERFPGLARDAEDETLPWVPGMLIRGVRELPVRW
ncbi:MULTISPECIES: cytochrome P450 [unclassified Streptomyces]|uniref:cytochrome P450 family protein n=1 Tax=unclassified Streptomyces TaxID=2593676 RepID=UPI000DC7E7E1|nr:MULTISPECIES: cytochrome P450 [unclassified Streptomyces]AWZ08204.1 cytochrome P450 [Streptomyces sp. ICC4]AWZ16007.1 cytochrome P450 [Streptomyces sp. ICC1]